MARETTISLRHHEYANQASFARMTEQAWGGGDGVAILPNRQVMNGCIHDGGKQRKSVQLAVVFDGASLTAYQVGGEWGTVFLIDAEDNSTQEFEPGASDEEDAQAWPLMLDSIREFVRK